VVGVESLELEPVMEEVANRDSRPCCSGHNALLFREQMGTLKQLRDNLALAQRDLAKLAGVAPSTIVDLETGRRSPRPSTRRKLARALKVLPNEIEFPRSRQPR